MKDQPHQLRPYYDSTLIEAGCDEAGRGCLAGPVVAAAVILPRDYNNANLNDSKQLTEQRRYALRTEIEEQAVAWAVTMVDNNEIDHSNILKASFHAMCLAVEQLSTRPDLLLIDGNRFYNETNINYKCFVKGDALFQSIAAASILAKTYRDDFMVKMHNEYPQYGWLNNKGYPTKAHYQAIEEHGISPLHRKTFRLDRQTALQFQ